MQENVTMRTLMLLLGLGVGLAACEGSRSDAVQWDQGFKRWQPQQALQIEDIRLLPRALAPGQADRVVVSERAGVLLLDAEGNSVAAYPGSFERLDLRQQPDQLQLITVDRDRQQVLLLAYSTEQQHWQPPQWLPVLPWAVEGVCLYQAQQHLFAFVLGSEGQGSQFLVATAGRWLQPVRKVRDLAIPPGAEICQTDDQQAQLYISEPGTGVWQYPAGAEAELQRQPVALRQPFGNLQRGADALALIPGGMLVLDSAAEALYGLHSQAVDWQQFGQWPLHQLTTLSGAEQISVRLQDLMQDLMQDQTQDNASKTKLEVLILGDSSQVIQGTLDLSGLYKNNAAAQALTSLPAIASVQPLVETQPVSQHGDAADDPAIWVHPGDARHSRVLGTNKQQGLLVYDLEGKLIQSFSTGRLNNVDVRYGPEFDIAVASNRDHNSLSIYQIEHQQGLLTYAGEVATELNDIYGTCLFQPQPGNWQVLVNDKDGRFQQYQLQFVDGKPQGKLMRQFKLDSQPEGCVVDDRQQRLFVGEEDVGVWVLDARADQPADKTLVLAVGDVLQADVEGLALYHGAANGSEPGWLVISSQGNDSYVVLDAQPPYSLRTVFRVDMNAVLGIDGASETDGLDVTALNLGAPWEQGLLVVQDGRNRLPEATQNFKLVPWSAVAPLLQTSQQH